LTATAAAAAVGDGSGVVGRRDHEQGGRDLPQLLPQGVQRDILRDALNPVPAALTERSFHGDEEYRRQNARVAVIQGCITIGALLKGHTQVVKYPRNVRE
ncbi:unnamed protein product, partial [Ectocarpus sp. 12 AP-2014]